MKKILLSLLMLLLLTGSINASDCKCKEAAADQTTRWGGNEAIVEKPDGVYKQLHGMVVYLGDKPLQDALVEIYDQPEYLLGDKAVSDGPQM